MQTGFEGMDKRNILSEIVFETSGELIRTCGQSPVSERLSVENSSRVVALFSIVGSML